MSSVRVPNNAFFVYCHLGKRYIYREGGFSIYVWRAFMNGESPVIGAACHSIYIHERPVITAYKQHAVMERATLVPAESPLYRCL